MIFQRSSYEEMFFSLAKNEVFFFEQVLIILICVLTVTTYTDAS